LSGIATRVHRLGEHGDGDGYPRNPDGPTFTLAEYVRGKRAAQPPGGGTIVEVSHLGSVHHHYERRAA